MTVSDTNKQVNDKPRVKKWKVVVGLALVLPFVAIQWLLHAEFFVHSVFDRIELAVPGLAFTNVSGRVAEGLQFDADYQDQQIKASVQALKIEFTLSCIFRRRLCVDSIDIDSIEIALQSQNGTTDAQDIELPTITLPVNIEVDKLNLGSLKIHQQADLFYQASGIHSQLSLVNSDLRVAEFKASDEYCDWELQLGLTLAETYPIASSITCETKKQLGPVSVFLSQSLAHLQVIVSAKPRHALLLSGGELSLEASIDLLESDLSFSLQAAVKPATKIAAQNDSVTFDNTTLSATGNRSEVALVIAAEGTHSRWQGLHQLNVQANANAEKIQLQEFAWQLPQGQLMVEGILQLTEGLSWQGEIRADRVDLSPYQSFIESELSGLFQTEAQFDDNWTAIVDIEELGGSVNQQTLQGSGQLRWQGRQLFVNRLNLEVENSRVMANGTIDLNKNVIDLDASASIPDVGVWLAESEGSLAGKARLQGTLQNPVVNGKFNASNIRYQSLATKSATFNVAWYGLESNQNRVLVELSGLSQGKFAADAFAEWNGSLAQHQWKINGQGLNDHEQKKLVGDCQGSWQQSNWSVECERFDIVFDYFDSQQQWQLNSPIKFDLNTINQTGRVASFCLKYQNQSLCNANVIEFNMATSLLSAISVQANAMSSQWFQPWLLPAMKVDGQWSAGITISNALEQAEITAAISADNTRVTWQQNQKQKPLNVTIQTLAANWQWQQMNQHQSMNWQFATQDSGSSRGQLSIMGESIGGQMSLQKWQLRPISRLMLTQPNDQLTGEVNAKFLLSGNLRSPVINGAMNIAQGAINLSALPVPIQDLTMDLKVNNNLAILKGKFLANESPGTLGGSLFWSPETWHSELSLSATDLTFAPEPNIQVTVSPDVKLSVSPQVITLTGEVQVPHADVTIKALPEQAISVSSDTVIVGDETTEQSQQVKTDLQLVLGDDVNFTGFGLTTQINGKLNLLQKPGELLRGQGVLQLKKGRYKAYGQDLSINSGDLVFVSDIENPQLRLEAIRDPLKTADDVTVGLRASGPARKPKITIFSDPALAQQAQMSYLLRGNAPDVAAESDPSQLAAQSALAFALESQTGEGITRFAGRAIGVEDLKVSTDSNENGTQIGLSGYLTPKLLVRYGVGVFDSVNSLTLNYQLKKNLYLEAVSGQSNALDILWSFEKD